MSRALHWALSPVFVTRSLTPFTPASQLYNFNSVLKKQLGRRIAELRQVARLTQKKLAKRTGYSVEFVSLVERGINAPSVEGCEKIAKALRVCVKDLFNF